MAIDGSVALITSSLVLVRRVLKDTRNAIRMENYWFSLNSLGCLSSFILTSEHLHFRAIFNVKANLIEQISKGNIVGFASGGSPQGQWHIYNVYYFGTAIKQIGQQMTLA